MTLPTTTTLNSEEDSDMFGPPRSPPHHHRSRVSMISPKLRQREERKRILQLCAHKLERIKDSETNLRRSVCINNTYCRLTDELRREKHSRYLANLPKSEAKPEAAHGNIFNFYSNCEIDDPNLNSSNKVTLNENSTKPSNSMTSSCLLTDKNADHAKNSTSNNNNDHDEKNQNYTNYSTFGNQERDCNPLITNDANESYSITLINNIEVSNSLRSRKRKLSSNNLDTDLEILDRELNAINSPMPLIDPEIQQGAEQLEKAVSSRKRLRSNEDESDRLVREALSQFYIPPQQRLISAIDDCPLDVVGISMGIGVGVGLNMGMNNVAMKRQKIANNTPNDLEIEFDMHQNQKEFEVIMDALRLSAPNSPTNSDSCGQAAMLSESANAFHNLVVTSLET